MRYGLFSEVTLNGAQTPDGCNEKDQTIEKKAAYFLRDLSPGATPFVSIARILNFTMPAKEE
jgi:hypothetical protein